MNINRPTVYTVFISRPSDMESEVDVVKQAISDANHLVAPLGIRIETFDWKENATPGIALEAQSRIDDQSNGYDALIGILGATIGTPTKRHASGCVGEIEDAINNASSSVFGNDSVMIFFKDVSLSLSSNLDEAKKVQELKHGLGGRGILYKSFNDDESLRSATLKSIGFLVSTHISGISNLPYVPNVEPISEYSMVSDIEEELGILDYGQIANDEMEKAGTSAELIGSAMNLLGEELGLLTQEIAKANSLDDRVAVRDAITLSASAMDRCSLIIASEGAAMSNSFLTSLKAVRDTIEIQKADLSADVSESEANVIIDVTESMSNTLVEVRGQMNDFRDGVGALPRMTKEINLSKRNLLSSVQNLIDVMDRIREENQSINDYCRSIIFNTMN